MKLGVILDIDLPERIAGSFTFQVEVLSGLVACKRPTQEIVLIREQSQSSRPRASASEKQFSTIAISPRVRRVSKAHSILRNNLSVFGIGLPRTTWFDRIARVNNIDIVWFASPGAAEVTDIPYIYTVWDVQHRLQPWFPEAGSGGVWQRLEHRYSNALRRAWRIIVGTEIGKRELQEFYQIPDERIKVLPLPAPRYHERSIEGRTRVLNKYGLPKGYLFYPAQFWPHKNHIGLLSAVELLRDKYGISLPVVLAGSDRGNLGHVRAAVEKQRLSGQVYFLGFVPREDIPDLYQNALALVYPTFFGPDNLPPLEAFALGCPVISSHYAGASEQLGSAALLVDPADCRALALAIKRIHEDRALREKLVQDGLARVAQWNGEDYVKAVLCMVGEFEPIRRCWGSEFIGR